MARTSRAGGSSRSPRRSGSFGRTSQRTGAVEFFTRPQTNPVWRVVSFLIRMRAEIVTVVAVILLWRFCRDWLGGLVADLAGWLAGSGWLGPIVTDPLTRLAAWPSLGTVVAHIATALLAVLIAVIPASRRFVIRRGWAVLSRHRVRSCFVQTRTMTHSGRVPLLVWSRPSPIGERLRVWLPAGMAVKDLEKVTGELATACWAREARVIPSRRQAALAVVHIVRRDPLSKGTLVPAMVDDLSYVVDGVPVEPVTVPPEWSTPLPDPADVTPAVTPAPDAPEHGRNGRKRPASAEAPASTSNGSDPVTGFGGVDVSDYV